jgi:GT2 family glycosyltransferase
MSPRIFAVVPVFNRIDFTKICIESLQNQSYKNYQIIVIDDGSSDGTSEYIQKHYKKVILLKGNGNLWWTGATNLGVQRALELSTSPDDFILTINNDLFIEEQYLANIINAYSKNRTALIGSITVDINSPKEVHFAGVRWNRYTAKYRSIVKFKSLLKELQDKYETIETDLLPGRGVLIPIKCFRELGLYDVENFSHYMADEDFSLRCKRSGYNLLIATNAVVFSHTEETGLKPERENRGFGFWKANFTSIKSPNNIKNRWNWARKNTPVPALYFLLDFARIFYSHFK